MKLVEFHVANFKSIEAASLHNIGAFNVLVGRNNVGKSNILDALEIFLLNIGRDGYSSLDGQITQDGLGNKSIVFSAVFHLPKEEITGVRSKAMRPYTNRGDVFEEIERQGYVEILFTHQLDTDLVWSSADIVIQPSVEVTGETKNITDFLREKLGDVGRIDVVRGHVPSDDNRLGMRRTIIPETTLADIKSWVDDRTQPINRTKFRNLQNTFKRLTNEDWLLIQDGDHLCVQDGDYLAEARSLGGGVQEMVELAFQLVDAPSILLIEEPESHSHPGQTKVIFDILKELSRERQLFVTTHSPTFASHVQFSEIFEVVKKEGRTTCKKIDSYEFSNLARSLGISPLDVYMTSSLIFVEGICDEIIIKSWGRLLNHHLNHPKAAFIHMKGMGRSKHLAPVWSQIIENVSISMAWIFDSNVENRLLDEIGKLGVHRDSVLRLELGNIEDYYPLNVVIDFLLQEYGLDDFNFDALRKEINGKDRVRNIQRFLHNHGDPQPNASEWKEPLASFVSRTAVWADYSQNVQKKIEAIISTIAETTSSTK
ncbi:MAG: ATP-dependent endonuclease [Candidatus Thorarchaeota archaeon]